MPDLVLEAHRRRVPIDHPLKSVTRTHLEYPTEDVSLAYLSGIGKTELFLAGYTAHIAELVSEIFTDKAIAGWGRDGARWQGRIDKNGNGYSFEIVTSLSSKDFLIVRWDNGSATRIASESVDLADEGYLLKMSITGSTLEWYRNDMTTPRISATDTTYSSGYFGVGQATITASRIHIGIHSCLLQPPSSSLTPARAIIESAVIGSGTEENPFRPDLKQELAEVLKIENVPEFLKREARRYELLKSRGFTDEEIEFLLGYIPQHQVDLGAVTWGVFDHKPGHSTMLLVVVGDNPYRGGAIEKQMEYAKARGLKVLKPPRDYMEAVEQYRELKKDFPEWIAGKDNYAYQVLGHEVLELFQVADTYYGNIVERIKPDAYKNVPDWEMRRTLSMWINRLKKVDVLTEERDKHIRKLEKVLRIGW